MVYISYDSSTNSWKPWRLMRIYIRDFASIPPWTHSQNSVPTTESPRLKISFHKTSLKRSQGPTYSAQSMETQAPPWSEFPNGQKATIDKIVVSEEKSKLKRAGLRESQSKILALINQSKNIFCSSIKVTLILVSLFLTSQVNIQTSKQLEE